MVREEFGSCTRSWDDVYETLSFFKEIHRNIALESLQRPLIPNHFKSFFSTFDSSTSTPFLYSSSSNVLNFLDWFARLHSHSPLRKFSSFKDLPSMLGFVQKHTADTRGPSSPSPSFPQVLMFFKLFSDSLSFKYYFSSDKLNDMLTFSTSLARPLQSLFLQLLKEHIAFYFNGDFYTRQSMQTDDKSGELVPSPDFANVLKKSIQEGLPHRSRENSISTEASSSTATHVVNFTGPVPMTQSDATEESTVKDSFLSEVTFPSESMTSSLKSSHNIEARLRECGRSGEELANYLLDTLSQK